jgi:hypothetical protein
VAEHAPLLNEQQEYSQSAQLDASLFDELDRSPRYHFEAVAAYFEENSRKAEESPSAFQTAAAWSRVRTYLSQLDGIASSDDATLAAPTSQIYADVPLFAAEQATPAMRAWIGLSDVSGANLKRLEGLPTMRSLS